ncbi:MAG: glycosyltransferase family 2 protein [Lachnospiraceae bacterium]|nr:glycosyltransferase family 2 protein [Lachnospiraceae bacterium]
MKLELLISAVNAEPDNLITKMRVASDAVLINQCGREDSAEMQLQDGLVRVLSFAEKGVGKSRNRAIDAAKGDILLFADDDIVYDEAYAGKVIEEFAAHPEADALFFNVEVCAERRTYFNTDYKRVHIWNGGRYPAYSIAVRKEALINSGVRFSELFGGGAKYSCGEDSLFIRDCLKAGLKMYRTTVCIGREEQRPGGESTWFKGYDEKYFFDRGVLYAYLYGALAAPMGLRYVYTKRTVMCRDIPWQKAYKILKKGIKEGRDGKRNTR